MKKFISIMLAIVSLIVIIPATQVSAQTNTADLDIIYLEDGGYILIEFSTDSNLTRATVSKSKIFTRYSDDDEMQWKITLSGSFSYDGITASCTSSNCTVTIYDSVWYTKSKTAWASANTAYATVEMSRKLLGVTVATEPINLTLTCDRYGKVS